MKLIGGNDLFCSVFNYVSVFYVCNFVVLLEFVLKDGVFSFDFEDELIVGCLIV